MSESVKITPDQRKEGVKAWHDADTDDKKREAVKKFPFLVEAYHRSTEFAPEGVEAKE